MKVKECRKVLQHRQRLAKLLEKPDIYYDEEEADRAVRFIERNTFHWKAPYDGQPFLLSDWQKEDIVKPLFGYRKNGERLFREAYIQLPRKNGKTSLTAAILLYLLVTGGNGVELYCAANKRDQAKIIFSDCVNFVRQSPALRKRLKIYQNKIEYPKRQSTLMPLASDANSLDGLSISACSIDEIHTLKNSHLIDVLRTATGSRREPLVIQITTAGVGEQNVCYDLYDYSGKILGGTIEADSFFCYIVEADKDLPWDSREAYVQANPNLGISIEEEAIKTELARAKEIPSKRHTYERYHLNRWAFTAAANWLDVEKWKNNYQAANIDKGALCFGGLDIASTTDLTAFSLLFPVNGNLHLKTWYWLPEDNLITRVQEDRVPYDQWKEEGWLESTPGNVIDAEVILHRIKQLSQKYNIRSVTYDPAFSFNIAPALDREGLEVNELKPNLTSIHPPTQQFEELYLGGKLKHDGNPVTEWCVSNVKIFRSFDGRMRPNKDKNKNQRIDGVMSSIFAVDGYMRTEDKEEFIFPDLPSNIRQMIGV